MTTLPLTMPPRGRRLPLEKVPFDFGAVNKSRLGACLAFALGLFAYLPYPAFPIGRNSAIQIGNVLTIVMILPALSLNWKRWPLLFFPLLMVPILGSTLKIGLAFDGRLELCFKAGTVWVVSALTMIATQVYAPLYLLEMMAGIATITVVHVFVGLWQFKAFTSGDAFPFVGFYINPSFLSVQQQATIIARYIQRPFGLFPEPSAMSSSLAPWVLFWLAEGLGVVRMRRPPTPALRRLFMIAALGGLLLIVLSRSGHMVVTCAAIVLFFIAWIRRQPATPRTLSIIVVVFGIVGPLIAWLFLNSLGDRLTENHGALGNGSWEDRAASIVIGAKLWTSGRLPTLFLGLGMGQTGILLWDSAHLDAVWSVLLTYVYETGIVGAVAVLWAGFRFFTQWRATRFRLVFGSIAIVWILGVTLTTSYQQLLPIWLTLGWLTIWGEVCDEPTAAPAAAARPLVRRIARPFAARQASPPLRVELHRISPLQSQSP